MNILITGATDGIGKQSALELAQAGHQIFIHGRSSERLQETKNWILNQFSSAKIETLIADFSSLKNVKKMADSLIAKKVKLNVLINNAGVFEKKLGYSKDGFELTFAINHLAHFYLTHLLLPLLKAGSPSRIINIASDAQANYIDFDALNAEKGFNSYDAYELSKLCNVLFTFKLAKILKPDGISVNGLHPGVISTKILHSGWGMGGGSWHSGAATTVYLATNDEGIDNSGFYYVRKLKEKASPAAYSIDNQDNLWQLSLKMCGLKD
ncbi:MAG: SDR family NAD(P)-dependent oxidoreductase [Bacteroidota bacterium]